MNKKIEILAATHQAASFVSQQLDSLLAQTYKNWTCLILDDKSTDQTHKIVDLYIKKYPNHFRQIPSNDKITGPVQIFSRLMRHSREPYIMFCDHDDVWKPDKIQISLDKMAKLESKYGSKIPLLVHSDLEVVDENLNIICESFWKYQAIDPEKNHFNRLLVQNTVTGSTILANRCLLDKCGEIPQNALQHDHWLALVASAFGKIGIIHTATNRYRQHDCNVIGAKCWGMRRMLETALDRPRYDHVLGLTILQAQAFLKNFGDDLLPQRKTPLTALTKIKGMSFIGKRTCLLKNRILKSNLIRNIAMMFYI